MNSCTGQNIYFYGKLEKQLADHRHKKSFWSRMCCRSLILPYSRRIKCGVTWMLFWVAVTTAKWLCSTPWSIRSVAMSIIAVSKIMKTPRSSATVWITTTSGLTMMIRSLKCKEPLKPLKSINPTWILTSFEHLSRQTVFKSLHFLSLTSGRPSLNVWLSIC